MQFIAQSGAQLVRIVQKVRQGCCQAFSAFRRWWQEDWDQRYRFLELAFGCFLLALGFWVSSFRSEQFEFNFVSGLTLVMMLVLLLGFAFSFSRLRKLSRLPRLLGYPKESVRTKAFAELLRQGEKAIPLFLQALSVSRSYWGGWWDGSAARALAAFGLGQLKAKEAVEPLMGLLRERPLSLTAQFAAIWALGELGDPKAIPVLMPFLGNLQAIDIQQATVDECLALPDGLPVREEEERLVKMLAQGWGRRISDWVAYALTKLGAQNLVDDFQRVLNERDEEALQRLKANFQSEVVTALMKVLDTYRHDPCFRETEPWVSNAAWALGKLRATEAISVLRREARRSPFPSVREVCRQVVKELEMLARLPMPANLTEFDRTNLPTIPNPNAFPTDNLPRPANAKAEEISSTNCSPAPTWQDEGNGNDRSKRI